jgi:CHRD domain
MPRLRRIVASAVLAAVAAAPFGLVVATPALAHPPAAHSASAHSPSTPVTAGRPVSFSPVLTGDQEVGVVGSQRGTVSVTFKLNPATGSVTFRKLVPTQLFEREDEFGPTKFHIHRGVKGQNGPVVVDFTDVANRGQTRGKVVADGALVAEIAADPGNFYINYHTISHPDGAVRGQLG